MTVRLWLRLAEVSVPAIIAVAILFAWQADRRDRTQLASQLAAAQQIIAQASANQKDRDAQLTQTLAQLTAQKQASLSTAQLLQLLPQALHIPAPLALATSDRATSDHNVGAGFSPSHGAAHAPTDAIVTMTPATESQSSSKGNSLPDKSHPNAVADNPVPKSSSQQNAAPTVALPSADLKPLYNFALDCQACQAKLTTAQADLADEKNKFAALTKQRDAALRAARGGSLLRRITRAAKWFALGAAAGAVAAKVTR